MKTFISTSIPYVNADPHIGHALEFVQADVIARWARQQGRGVFFLTGTDDNALKNIQAAEKAGAAVKEWVDQRAENFKNLAAALNLSNDDFIRTSVEERHIKGVQKLWRACQKDIYKKKYSGLYCVGCESFKTEKELINGECPEHSGKKLELVEEENYFFKLSKYQAKLLQLIESGEFKIIPESRKHEIINFIKAGLEDFSISRSKERAKNGSTPLTASWGIPVPGDPEQLIYVWFDALANYINALGYAENSEQFKNFWVNGDQRIHIVGKDINRFHTVYWPAMLLSAGVRLPSEVFVHGFITVNGKKMSKTVGNVIDPFELIEKYGSAHSVSSGQASSLQVGTDAVRYYLLREIPAYEDGDFSIEKFEGRYNSDLANGIGNFAARVLTLASSDTNIRMHTNDINNANNLEKEVETKINETREIVAEKLAEFKFNEALEAIWGLITFGDVYVNEKKPWNKEQVASDKQQVIFNLIVILDNVSGLLKPFLPATAAKITEGITWEGDKLKIKKIAPLFPRLT